MGMEDGIIKLHGRVYKTVALRVHEFRETYTITEGWGIITKMVHCDADTVIFRAAIVNANGVEVGTGFAEEKRTNRGINSTSALENAETSSIGRALAAVGLGGSEYASANEVVNARHQQDRGQTVGPARLVGAKQSWFADAAGFKESLSKRGLDYTTVSSFCESRKWGAPHQWDSDERKRFLADADAGAFKELYEPPAKG